jgi:hypothetical protein
MGNSIPTEGTDRPATQRELMQAQIDAQEQLFLQVTNLDQKLKEGFDHINLAFLGLSERLARMEGARNGFNTGTDRRLNRTHLLVVVVGISVSSILGMAGLLSRFL